MPNLRFAVARTLLYAFRVFVCVVHDFVPVVWQLLAQARENWLGATLAQCKHDCGGFNAQHNQRRVSTGTGVRARCVSLSCHCARVVAFTFSLLLASPLSQSLLSLCAAVGRCTISVTSAIRALTTRSHVTLRSTSMHAARRTQSAPTAATAAALWPDVSVACGCRTNVGASFFFCVCVCVCRSLVNTCCPLPSRVRTLHALQAEHRHGYRDPAPDSLHTPRWVDRRGHRVLRCGDAAGGRMRSATSSSTFVWASAASTPLSVSLWRRCGLCLPSPETSHQSL